MYDVMFYPINLFPFHTSSLFFLFYILFLHSSCLSFQFITCFKITNLNISLHHPVRENIRKVSKTCIFAGKMLFLSSIRKRSKVCGWNCFRVIVWGWRGERIMYMRNERKRRSVRVWEKGWGRNELHLCVCGGGVWRSKYERERGRQEWFIKSILNIAENKHAESASRHWGLRHTLGKTMQLPMWP